MISSASVVIPAYNASESIAKSVYSALALNLQVIVVDDGSSDGTAMMARSAGAVVITQPNSGAAWARRRGLDEVATDYCIFLDADDELSEGVLKGLRELQRFPQHTLIVGSTIVVSDARESLLTPWVEGVSLEAALGRGVSVGPPSAIVWRTSALRAAVVDEVPWLMTRYAEDYELLIRGLRTGPALSTSNAFSRYSPVGGKSTSAPMRSLTDSEKIRRHYSHAYGIPILPRSNRELRSLVILRRSWEAKLAGRTFVSLALRIAGIGSYPRSILAQILRYRRSLKRRS